MMEIDGLWWSLCTARTGGRLLFDKNVIFFQIARPPVCICRGTACLVPALGLTECPFCARFESHVGILRIDCFGSGCFLFGAGVVSPRLVFLFICQFPLM